MNIPPMNSISKRTHLPFRRLLGTFAFKATGVKGVALRSTLSFILDLPVLLKSLPGFEHLADGGVNVGGFELAEMVKNGLQT